MGLDVPYQGQCYGPPTHMQGLRKASKEPQRDQYYDENVPREFPLDPVGVKEAFLSLGIEPGKKESLDNDYQGR